MNKLIPLYQSHKIKVCYLVLIILVVFLHSNLTQFGAEGINYKFQYLVAHGFASVGVVMFYALSGFLFFFTDKPYNISFFLSKLKKRFFSVFTPFVLWNCIGILIATIIFYTQDYYNLGQIEEPPIFSFTDLLYSIFFYNVYTYQLWFLRDLIILFLASPLLCVFIKFLKVYFLIPLLLFCIFPCNIGFVNAEAIIFFCTGAFFAIVFPSLLVYKVPFRTFILVSSIYIIGTFFYCFLPPTTSIFGLSLRFLGCFTLWYGYDFIKILQTFDKNTILTSSFFIYTAHEPLLTIIKKIFLALLGNSQCALLLIFLSSPIICITICIIIKNFLNKYFPIVHNILTGNR